MDVLSDDPRCNHCGARLPGPELGECPNCHSALAQVGVWSELLEWGQTRRIGRARYVWRRWILGWGSLMALAMSLGFFLRGNTPWPVYTWIVSGSLVGGFCLGRLYWRSAERQYEAAARRGLTRPCT